MGRSGIFYCRTCKKRYYLGYGSATTWLDHARSVEEYDQIADRKGHLRKNQNMRRCLAEHAGHQFETHSADWTYVRDGVLYSEFGPMGTGVPLVEDYNDWEEVDLIDE